MADVLTEDQITQIHEYVKEHMDIQQVTVTPKMLEKKGEGIDEYVQAVGNDFSHQLGHSGYFEEGIVASDNYFPLDYDMNIYDQGVLYNMTPYMTFMEAQGRRFPTGFKTIQYLKATSGFALETHTETTGTAGAGTMTTGTATASVKFMSVPINLSDLIGMGESGNSRLQILQYAMGAFREGFNAALVNGNSSNDPNSMDGIITIAEATGYRKNMASAEMTVKDMRFCDSYLRNNLKEPTGAVLTNDYVVDQIEDDMAARFRTPVQFNLAAGLDINGFVSKGQTLPMVSDPNVTITSNQKKMLFFQPRNIFIEDFLSPTMITAGKTIPLATSYWLTGVSAQYCVKPTKMVEAYGIS
jgi:hypothetical protein